MLNHITLMGRLTRDPELRYTQSGTPVASFSLAVERDFGSRDGGERQTDFIDIVAWRQTGEFVSKYFSKGRMAIVSGRLQMRDWTDKDGNKYVIHKNESISFPPNEGRGLKNESGKPAKMLVIINYPDAQ